MSSVEVPMMFLLFPLRRETSEMIRHFVFTIKTTQARSQVFSVNCSLIWQFCCTTDVISSHIAKFFQIWSRVAGCNELCVAFSQSETEKYFQWTKISIIHMRAPVTIPKAIAGRVSGPVLLSYLTSRIGKLTKYNLKWTFSSRNTCDPFMVNDSHYHHPLSLNTHSMSISNTVERTL